MKCLARGNAGLSLVAVLVSVAIAGLLIAVLTQMMSNQLKTQKHLSIGDELRSLRMTVEKRLSCHATLPEAVLAKCAAKNELAEIAKVGKFLTLKDKNGRTLGQQRADGTMVLGSWHLRAQCVKSTNVNTLAIYTARMAPDNKISKDPLTGKNVGWMMLFAKESPMSSALCAEEISGNAADVEAEHLESVVMEEGIKKGCGDGLLQTIFGGAARIYSATVTCPASKRAVGGGAECMPGSASRNLLTFIAGSPKGLMISNRPANNGQGWFVECCIKAGGILGLGGKMPGPRAFAVCIDR